MRICVIGSGISGLAAAHRLSSRPDFRVAVYEQADHFGGRADVDADGEHCPRFFMDDYEELFGILRTVGAGDGRSVVDTLRRVRRYAHTPTAGWVEISHLYLTLAKEVPLAEKFRLLRAWRATPLVADQGRCANRYGSVRNYSLLPLLRMTANLLRSKSAYALPGPTDECLIAPWVAQLRANGVELSADTRVTMIRPHGSALNLTTTRGTSAFDAVVVTAFVPDLVTLLTASRLGHTVREAGHTHCVAFTLDLDPRERILTAAGPALYCRDGINALVQPEHACCVVLCTTAKNTEAASVLPKVRRSLGLEHDFVRVRSRLNQRPAEAVFVGDYLEPDRILRHRVGNLYFAGSAVRNSYPIDSAEGAVRSAFNAVDRLCRDFGASGVSGGRRPPRRTAVPQDAR